MRIFPYLGIGLTLATAGCFLFESFASLDSLGNGTESAWRVAVDFASGKHLEYEQAPGRFAGYSRTAKNAPMPIVTNIVVRSADGTGKEYSLSNCEILTLRRATAGRLELVIYDEGLASLPPSPKPNLRKPAQTQQDYIQLLIWEKTAALSWTRKVLSSERCPAGSNGGRVPR